MTTSVVTFWGTGYFLSDVVPLCDYTSCCPYPCTCLSYPLPNINTVDRQCCYKRA